MISFKKSYAEQLLQLALALSLLHVDPESYLGRGWESQLELRNGDGWQLEMLRAVPVSDYPYANRKAMMPLIEDLIRFDRQTNLNDVTAYLLNVQDGGNNQTVSSQELDSSGGGGGGGAVSVEPSPVNNTATVGLPEIDLFLNSEHFLEQESITDQNLADLGEYGDIPLSYFPYYGLPLKDEPPEAFPPIDFNLETNQASTSSIAGLRSWSNGDGTVVTWNEIANTTREIKKEEDDKKSKVFVKQELDFFKSPDVINEKNQASTSANEGQAETKIIVKKEPGTEGGEEKLESNVELTEEESEIVEVLWKQDVDLGFSLSPPKLISNDAGTSTSTKNSEDEVEKLKALQELKEDKPKDDSEKQDELDDEWAGIPFRIDNETGEYIRLPLQLDEILQDVLQLADLTTEDPEEPENKADKSESATSKKSSEKSKTDGASNSSDGCAATVEPPQSEVEISSLPSPLFDLEDASELDDLDMMIQSAGPFQHHRPGQNYATNSAFRQSGFHHHHQSRVPLSRGVSMEQRLQDIASLFNPIPGMGVGMGVGDMSPYPHYPTHYPYQSAPGIPQHSQFPHPPHPVLHNASLADLGATQPHYGHNLGSAVTSSMHLTNSSHEADSGAAGYKMEHDMMYYSNTSSELNHTTDGFINSFLNDEDLQLMDMGVNEGFCTMRMLEGNATSNNSSVLGSSSGGSHGGHLLSSMPSNLGTMTSEGISTGGDRLDASSDSAVSSMGSERVPSLSDGEWGDAGSDSAQEFHQGKYGGPYDYSYSSRLGDTSRQPVAQKKHQMFGKRYFQEQPNMPLSQAQSAAQPADHLATPVKYEYEPYGLHQNPSAVGHNMEGAVGPLINKNHVPLMTNSEMKYACSLDFSARPPRSHDLISHNHTYTLPQGSGSTPRPQIRDKKQKKAEDEHLTRDEKRARSLNIPIAVHDIINLPMDEFNERLSKYDLTENQLSLIRDIRRRGKNKVAAQNCRKRKLDQILSLEDEVREVRRRKDRLYQDREVILAERKRIANKFAALHRHVFQYLRDADGNPCSPSEYSLQQAADGSVYLLRRENNKPDGSSNGSGSNHTGNTNGHHQHSTQGPSPPSHHQKE